jgi:hypothetical protein
MTADQLGMFRTCNAQRRLPELFDPQFSSLVTQLLCRAGICQWHEFDVQYGCEIFNARMWQYARSSIENVDTTTYY